MSKEKSTRIEKGKWIVEVMIRMYCKKKEKNDTLCPDCVALLRYAHSRLDHCQFGESKKACKNCPVHCYKPIMRERMKKVMRFSGPRMIIYSPIEVFRHVFL